MSADIIIFFRHECRVPLPEEVIRRFEDALIKSALSLDQFGLRGSIGDCDVLYDESVDDSGSVSVGVQKFTRLDIQGMTLNISSKVAVLGLPIRWADVTADSKRFSGLVKMLDVLVDDFSVSEMIVAPYPLESVVNQAYEYSQESVGYDEIKRFLASSAEARVFVKASGGFQLGKH